MENEKIMKTGIKLIKKEREEQIVKHGFDQMFDILNNSQGQLISAAEFLISHPDLHLWSKDEIMEERPLDWNETYWIEFYSK